MKNLFWVCMGTLFLLAGIAISYGLGWLISGVIVAVAKVISILPGTNVIAEFISGTRILWNILIAIVVLIYFWSKYEDKAIVKNFKESSKELFHTVKNRDYSKEKETIKACGKKIKNVTAETTVKIKNNINDRIQRKNGRDVAVEECVEEDRAKKKDVHLQRIEEVQEDNR